MVQCISEQCVNDSIAFCIPTCCSCFSFSFAYYFLFVLLITMIFHIKLNHVFTIAQHSLLLYNFKEAVWTVHLNSALINKWLKLKSKLFKSKTFLFCIFSVEFRLKFSYQKVQSKLNRNQIENKTNTQKPNLFSL